MNKLAIQTMKLSHNVKGVIA